MSSFTFPNSFRLRNIAKLTASTLGELPAVSNSKLQRATEAMFSDAHTSLLDVFDAKAKQKLLALEFNQLCASGFDNPTSLQLVTIMTFFSWMIMADDLIDTGDPQADPELAGSAMESCTRLLRDPFDTLTKPDSPHGSILYEFLKHIHEMGTPGAYNRFTNNMKEMITCWIEQCDNRSLKTVASIEHFLVMRRQASGWYTFGAMVEGVFGYDIPDILFNDPTVKAMAEALDDITSWTNDICSFNKEQKTGDYQNLVCCVIEERGLDLQEAIDFVINMISSRLVEYQRMQAELPTFGPEVDDELARYHRANELFAQVLTTWYCRSHRYFKYSENNLDKDESIIILYS